MKVSVYLSYKVITLNAFKYRKKRINEMFTRCKRNPNCNVILI